jgi:hypothetical protein
MFWGKTAQQLTDIERALYSRMLLEKLSDKR